MACSLYYTSVRRLTYHPSWDVHRQADPKPPWATSPTASTPSHHPLHGVVPTSVPPLARPLGTSGGLLQCISRRRHQAPGGPCMKKITIPDAARRCKQLLAVCQQWRNRLEANTLHMDAHILGLGLQAPTLMDVETLACVESLLLDWVEAYLLDGAIKVVVWAHRTEIGVADMAAYGFEESTQEIVLKEDQSNAITITLTVEGEARSVPMNDTLTMLLKSAKLHAAEGERVFCYRRGQP